jgi:glycosyltransferase involved in cell wall biosynthesis
VRDGETGFVVKASGGGNGWRDGPRREASQVADVAQALATVLADPVLARRMGEAGRRRAEEELSYDILASKLAAALEQL